MPRVDAERLIEDLQTLRGMGARGSGVVRPALSPDDMRARRWLAGRFAEAGLEPTIDGVGNVLGRSRNDGPALLVGSHSDTQPTGGWLDGALGVVYALEVARALAEDRETRGLALDAVSWQDEESRFVGCLGSRSYCGLLTPEMESGARDRDGVSLEEAVRDAGLEGYRRLRAEPGRHVGFLEAHIEQGPHLEDAGHRIGVVSSIVGLGGRVFTFRGQQNHAGTTMMSRRRDAATALFALAQGINEAFPAVAGERSVWTMGRVEVHPGAPSIVPGHAELELQFRDASPAVLDAFEATAERLAAEIAERTGVEIAITPARARIAPAHMDEGLRGHLAAAAERHAPGAWQHMPSGAFHDAGVIASTMPCAMLFIPSIGGISHDFAEDSHLADIALGCQVLADACASILGEARSG